MNPRNIPPECLDSSKHTARFRAIQLKHWRRATGATALVDVFEGRLDRLRQLGAASIQLTRFDREDCGGLARVRQHMIGGTGQSQRAADASLSPKLAKYTKIE